MVDGGEEWNGFDDMVVSLRLQALVVDRSFRIRLVTPAAASLLRLDRAAAGQPVTGVSGSAARSGLMEDVRLVLAGGGEVRRVVVLDSGERATRRSLPYRSGGKVQGVVVTFEAAGAESVARAAAAADPNGVSRSGAAQLTIRQREILDRVVAGDRSKHIAAELGISVRTVENHRSNIMRRTGCRSLPELTRFALLTAPEAGHLATRWACGDASRLNGQAAV